MISIGDILAIHVVAVLFTLIRNGCHATKCYQCVYFSNMDEDDPLRYEEKFLQTFMPSHYDRDLFYNVKNGRACFTGPTQGEASKILVGECPNGCQTYYREENNGRFAVIRSCAKGPACFSEMLVDRREATHKKCCSGDWCNDEVVIRATRCHRCSYNPKLNDKETLIAHYQKYGQSSKTGLEKVDIDMLGYQGTIPNHEVCIYNPWETEQVLCPSKTCSVLEFRRGIDGVHTIIRDCLKPGKYCETDLSGARIKCCMENVCNGNTMLYFSWSLLIGILAGIILLR